MLTPNLHTDNGVATPGRSLPAAAGTAKPAPLTAQVQIVGAPASSGAEARVICPGWYPACKAVLDWLCAATLLVLTAPLLLTALVLVKLTSRGPVLYSQTRLGRHGMPFTIYKVRSMYAESESLTGACWSTPGDSRVTPVGRWLRRTHIDELPQLWNVLRGDMSLIGPRPERPEFVPTLEQAIRCYRARLLVRPGITGFAQVQLPPDTDLMSVQIKTAYDLFYVQHVSFSFDLRIGWATALKMIGVKFLALGRIFRFPPRATIEREYQQLIHPDGAADTVESSANTTQEMRAADSSAAPGT
jgi:lipopolysaccharide/colanic/teichoic acid biosynthesis glycosyltransferase